jgi:hypothetical protein
MLPRLAELFGKLIPALVELAVCAALLGENAGAAVLG